MLRVSVIFPRSAGDPGIPAAPDPPRLSISPAEGVWLPCFTDGEPHAEGTSLLGPSSLHCPDTDGNFNPNFSDFSIGHSKTYKSFLSPQNGKIFLKSTSLGCVLSVHKPHPQDLEMPEGEILLSTSVSGSWGFQRRREIYNIISRCSNHPLCASLSQHRLLTDVLAPKEVPP